MRNLPNGKNNPVHFPDGTLAPRPNDGFIFKSYSGDEWSWSDKDGQWNRKSLSTGKSNGWWLNPSSESDSGRGWRSMYFPESESNTSSPVVVIKVCECGSEKVGAFGHSSWCPKYEG